MKKKHNTKSQKYKRYIISFNSEETTRPMMHCKDFAQSLSWILFAVSVG